MRNRLREKRLAKGITQTFIAKKLGFTSASGYNNIEMGRNKPSIQHAKIISEILGESIEEIFFGVELHEECKSEVCHEKC